jgi:hypothetical protein
VSSSRLPYQESRGEGSSKDYKQFLNQLTLNKVGKVMKDRDIEIHEMHNRIKKLLIEEQRTIKKIDETRRRASIMVESSRMESFRKREHQPSLKKELF